MHCPGTDLQHISNPVLFFNNGIGDHLINMPSIRAIHALFGNKLSIILEKGFYDLLYSDLQCRMVVEIGIRYTPETRHFEAREVFEKLHACDLFICINPWHSKDVDLLLEHYEPDLSVGFFNAFRYCLPIDHSKHSAEMAFDVVRFLWPAACIQHFSYPPRLPKAAQLNALAIYEKRAAHQKVLVVHADTAEEKMFPIASFKAFLQRFLDHFKGYTVLVVGMDDLGLHEVPDHEMGIFSCVGEDLATSMAIVALADVFVGVDSCMLHVADAFRIPGVGIFGPTDKNEFGFRNSQCCYVDFQQVPETL